MAEILESHWPGSSGVRDDVGENADQSTPRMQIMEAQGGATGEAGAAPWPRGAQQPGPATAGLHRPLPWCCTGVPGLHRAAATGLPAGLGTEHIPRTEEGSRLSPLALCFMSFSTCPRLPREKKN